MRIIDLSAPIVPSREGAASFERVEIRFTSHAEGAAQIEALVPITGQDAVWQEPDAEHGLPGVKRIQFLVPLAQAFTHLAIAAAAARGVLHHSEGAGHGRDLKE